MRFNEAFLEQIVAKNDIVDVIGASVELKSSGFGSFKALCPFHNDHKTPSMSISADKQVFHCFGCGAGGSVIQFVMLRDGLDFYEAVISLAERAKIPLPAGDDDAPSINHDERQRLYDLHAFAAKYYHDQLHKPIGQYALKYAQERELSENTIRKFGLGFAPPTKELIELLEGAGFTHSVMLQGGITGEGEKGDEYLRFRGRLMFPIIDLRKNVIAFGGRALSDEQEPKYLNTSATPIFNKSDNLFALNFAKNSPARFFILAEGYMDVIALHQAGFGNAVATLGTALTQTQARKIRKYRQEVVIAYDSDDAGQKATARAIELLSEEGIRARVLTLPDCKDPDEYIKKHGKTAFAELLRDAPVSIEYTYKKLQNVHDLTNSEGKIAFTQALARELAKAKSAIEREVYAKKAEDDCNVSAQAILAETSQIAEKAQKTQPTAPTTITVKPRGVSAQEQLLSLMLGDKQCLEKAKTCIKPEDFAGEFAQNLARELFNNAENLATKFPEKIDEIAKMIAMAENLAIIQSEAAIFELAEKVKQERRKLGIIQAAQEADATALNTLVFGGSNG